MIHLTFGKRCFQPKLITSLWALVFFALFIGLGFWQLARAEYKRARYEIFLNQQTALPVDLNDQVSDQTMQETMQKNLWQPAIAKGYFHHNIHILLDNQVLHGQAGYFVYTPLQLDDSDRWLLVNQGWLSLGASRDTVPALEQTTTAVVVNGLLKAPPRTGILLGAPYLEKMTDTIVRVQQINLDALATLLDLKLLPRVLQLDAGSEYGYVRDWALPDSDESMHQGYAFQWFSFAAVLLVIYLVTNIHDRREKDSD